jgi:simple sugar transport system permease protein
MLSSVGNMNALSSIMAVLLGLLAGLVILLLTNPPQAMGAFKTILVGGFINMRSFGNVLYYATPIIMTGLSVGFAGKTGLFNIGASGQFIVGAYAAIFVGVRFTFLPGALHWITALLAAVLAGALWGSIPGILKAWRNVHEVIACIMTNYIAMYLVNSLIMRTVFDPFRNMTQRVRPSAILPKAGLDAVFHTDGRPSSANSGIFIAVAACILMYVILEKTKLGYELKACGYNRDAAKYAGINEARGIVVSMATAGGLAGLGGALLYLAGSGNGITVVDVLASEGFQGIPVALLGLNNPIGILFAGLLISHLSVGGFQMQLYDFAPQIIEIIIAVIIYFSALALLLKGFIARLLRKGKRGDS